MEKSIFMIKPEAINHQEEIMSYIDKGGLKITRFRTMTLTEDELRKIYHDTHGSLWEKTKEHFLNKEVLVGEVENEDAIENLKKICGTKTDGAVCEIGSVRNMFRDLAERDTFKYHKNIIHRAMDQKEVDDQTIVFFPEKNLNER